MSNQAHTPGPWTSEGEAGHIVARDEIGGLRRTHSIACVYGDSDEWPLSEEAQANARLIAAAPTMLAALHEARAILQTLIGRGIQAGTQSALDDVEHAIRQAEGGAE